MKDPRFLTPTAIAGYRFRTTKDRPDLKAIEFVTEHGDLVLVLTKAQMLRLSADLAASAAGMATDRSTN